MAKVEHNPIDVIRGFQGLRVLLLGDVMLDTYIEGTATRLCREGPVPVLDLASQLQAPGGAANVGANLAALGAQVSLVGIVGKDRAGAELRAALGALGVADHYLIEDDQCSTMRKSRLSANGQYIVRLDEGETRTCTSEGHRRLLQIIEQEFESCDLVVVSDYGYGAVSDAAIEQIAHLRGRRHVVLAVDAKNVLRHARSGATVITPSLAEACNAIGSSLPDRKPIPLSRAIEIGQELRKLVDAEHLAVTLADDGVILLDLSDGVSHVPAHLLNSANDVGAGDTFLASIALALAAEATPGQAAQIAVDAASLAVLKTRTAVVGHQELLGRVSLTHLARDLSPSTLASILDGARFADKTIVFTNGVFDILHAGHVDLLRRAKSLGDILVVGINSDASTRRLKGRNRPINHERDRLALVSALHPVDYAVLFEDDTPEALIRAFRPHIHVKGGDYRPADLMEAEAVAEVGGRIEILPFVAGRSTTKVIDRITALYSYNLTEARP